MGIFDKNAFGEDDIAQRVAMLEQEVVDLQFARRQTRIRHPWVENPEIWRHAEHDFLFALVQSVDAHGHRAYGQNHDSIQVPTSVIMEVVDVSCSHANVGIDLVDAGTNRFVASLSEDWLVRTERSVATPLAQLLELVVDIATEKRTQDLVDVLVEAIQQEHGRKWLLSPILLAPNSALILRPHWIDEAGDRSRAIITIRTIWHTSML